jgi:hypothetical protein
MEIYGEHGVTVELEDVNMGTRFATVTDWRRDLMRCSGRHIDLRTYVNWRSISAWPQRDSNPCMSHDHVFAQPIRDLHISKGAAMRRD